MTPTPDERPHDGTVREPKLGPVEQGDAQQNERGIAGHEKLEALRRGTGPEARKAIEELWARLQGVAANKLGEKAGRADFQPESIVASVMARELNRCVASCNDDEHLNAFLAKAVAHKIYDRFDKKNPGRLPETDSGEPWDPSAGEPSPASVLDGFTRARRDREQISRLVQLLREACKNESERTMVDMFLDRGVPWSAVAAQMGKNENAAKTAFSRLRERLLTAALEPMRGVLSGPAWQVAESLAVKRQTPAAAAAELGIRENEVATLFQERVLPCLKDGYGRDGLEILLRLLGAGGGKRA